MIKIRMSLRGLFSNNKFLLLFSIVMAVIFWIAVVLEYSPIKTITIEDVPVKINIENSVPDKLGLQPFGVTDYSVDITIKGKRYEIEGKNEITAEDFDVIAETAYVDSAGNHSLKIKVSPKISDGGLSTEISEISEEDSNSKFEIIGKSAEYIEVFFDKKITKEVGLKPVIVKEIDPITDTDYLFDEKEDIYLERKTINVSGPKSEIDKITGAEVLIPIDKKLTESKTIDGEVRLISDDELKYCEIDDPDGMIPANLQVYKVETLSVDVSFKHTPPHYLANPLKYSCYPSQVKVAVLQRKNNASEINEVLIGDIDFNEISSQKSSFTQVPLKNSDDIKLLDNTQSFIVNIDVADFTTKTFSIDKKYITVKGVDDQSSVSVTVMNNGLVEVCGSATNLLSVKDSDLAGTIDLTGIDISDTPTTVNMTVDVLNKDNCWVTGTYKALVVANN